MTSLFGLTGMIFWVIIAIWVLSMILSVETRRDGELEVLPAYSFLLTAGLLVALFFSDKTGFVDFFKSFTIMSTVMSVAGYIILGLSWSFVRWIIFIKERYKYVLSKRPSDLDDIEKSEYISDRKPKALDNSEKITVWCIFWPFSLSRFCIGDGLFVLIQRITSYFGGTYDRITDGIFKA